MERSYLHSLGNYFLVRFNKREFFRRQSRCSGTMCDCKTDRLWVRYHTQCLQTLAESGERSVLTLSSLRFPLPTLLCGIQREAKKKWWKPNEIFLFIRNVEVSHGAGAQACHGKRVGLWVRFPLEDMKHLIISCLCSGVEAMCGIEFHDSTRYAELGGKCVTECLYTRLPLLHAEKIF